MASPRGLVAVATFFLCSSMLCCTGNAQASAGSDSTNVAHSPLARNPALPTLWIVGNGGVNPAAAGGSATWVPWFTQLFDPAKINIADASDTGSATREYITNQRWAAILSLVRPGDIAMIQFSYREFTPERVGGTGSLPGTSDDLREVGSATQPKAEVVHTYGWYLREYVVETIARGATPILCSPAPTGSSTPNQDDDIAWTRAIAVQQRVAFIDLSASPKLGTHGLAATSGATPTPGAATTGPAIPQAIVAALKGMPNDPLAGYFSAMGNAILPNRPPAPPPGPTVPPL